MGFTPYMMTPGCLKTSRHKWLPHCEPKQARQSVGRYVLLLQKFTRSRSSCLCKPNTWSTLSHTHTHRHTQSSLHLSMTLGPMLGKAQLKLSRCMTVAIQCIRAPAPPCLGLHALQDRWHFNLNICFLKTAIPWSMLSLRPGPSDKTSRILLTSF